MVLRGELSEISRIGSEELSVEWQIADFPSLRRNSYYYSPKFYFGDESWYLELWPYVVEEWRDTELEWVALRIYRYDCGPPKTFHVKVGIMGSRGVEMEREVEREFPGHEENYFDWYTYCKRSELEEQGSRLMPDHTLTIKCIIKRVEPAAAAANEAESDDDDDEDDDDDDDDDDDGDSEDGKDEADNKASKSGKNSKQQNQEEYTKKRIEKLSEDIGKLLDSGEKSDVTVQVGDVEIQVHGLILFARCPALSVSLQHESKEKASNRIVIEDCQPDVFRDFLHYIYKGSAPILTERNVFGLFRVADKYLADDLKEQCLEHIRGTLNVRTFCDAVQLALTHEENGLLEQAMDFATGNIRLIIRSVEWQNFSRDYPTEANEILIKALGPPSSKEGR